MFEFLAFDSLKTSLIKEPLSRRYTPIGVDIVLCPSLIVSHQISRIFSFPSTLSKIKKHNIDLYRATIEDDSYCVDKKLSELGLPQGARIVSIFRGINHILPTDSFVLRSEDEICLFVDERIKTMQRIQRTLGCDIKPLNQINNVFIGSATEIGVNIAEELLKSNISVVLMDLSKKRAKAASEKLVKAQIIQADPLGHGVLVKEEIEKFDVLFSVGQSLERNIFLSILAKRFNVSNAIALIDRIDLKESIEGTLVDSAIVPNLLLVNTILNVLKGQKSPRLLKKKRLLRIKDLQTDEIVLKEIKVTKKVRCVDKKVGTLSPEIGNFLIAGISKKDESFVPSDDYILSAGDTIFVLHHKSSENALNRWFIG